MDEIMEKLCSIERNSLLAAKNVLNIDDVSLLTGLSCSSIYKMTCTRNIPFYKNGKFLYFDKKEIENWMKSQRFPTNEEAEQKAINHIINKQFL